jgi:hypothetical protein
MTLDTLGNSFPDHFDGKPLNPEGTVPDVLPFQFTNGTCTFQFDSEYVHILNKSDGDEEGVRWSEPLSAYADVRHWVIVQKLPKVSLNRGMLSKLLGFKVKRMSVDMGHRQAVVALAHKKESWMSIILFSRELEKEEPDELIEEIAGKYRALLNFN